jgi:hypothetical protein
MESIYYIDVSSGIKGIKTRYKTMRKPCALKNDIGINEKIISFKISTGVTGDNVTSENKNKKRLVILT